jgi:hypothetical protein
VNVVRALLLLKIASSHSSELPSLYYMKLTGYPNNDSAEVDAKSLDTQLFRYSFQAASLHVCHNDYDRAWFVCGPIGRQPDL